MASIDVAVPCYNYGHYLRDCVESILAQDVDDLRVLILDNASTDDSATIARQLAGEDPRVEVVVNQRNIGPHGNYNKAVDWASADYFLLVDADDVITPGALRRAMDVLEKRPDLAFVHGLEARRVFEAGAAPEIAADMLCGTVIFSTGRALIERLSRFPVNSIDAPTVVRRTSAQKKAGYYRPELPYTDDLELWLRLALIGDAAELSCVQAVRRIHATRASNHYQGVQVRDFAERVAAFESFFSREGRVLPDADSLLLSAKKHLGHHAYWSAISHLIRGHPGTAWQLLKFAIKQDPVTLIAPPVSWLFRMQQPLRRAKEIVLEATGYRAGTY